MWGCTHQQVVRVWVGHCYWKRFTFIVILFRGVNSGYVMYTGSFWFRRGYHHLNHRRRHYHRRHHHRRCRRRHHHHRRRRHHHHHYHHRRRRRRRRHCCCCDCYSSSSSSRYPALSLGFTFCGKILAYVIVF